MVRPHPAAGYMSSASRFRIGYLLADPGVDLSKQEGCRVHVERVVGSLREAGHDVTFVAAQRGDVVLTDSGYGLQQFFEAARLEKDSGRPSVLHSAELLRLAQRNRFPANELSTSDLVFCAGRRAFRGCDLLYARFSPFDVGGVLCALDLGIPLVVEVNTPPLLEAMHFYPGIFRDRSERLARFAAKETLAAADSIVTVSAPLRDMLVSDWSVDPAMVTVLPNAADAIRPTTASRLADLRLQYGLGSGPVIAFVGALQPWHGLDELVEAFARVRTEYPGAKLLLVGDGPVRESLEDRVSALGLQLSTRFTGAVAHDRVGELLALADVAVAPYPQLPFDFYFSPIKIFEYMAAGKAIVASCVGQIADVLTDGETALLVEPGCVEELAHAIGCLLADERRRRRLGEGARLAAERNHTWTGYAAGLTQLYERLAHSRG